MKRSVVRDADNVVVNIVELPDDYDAKSPGSWQPPLGHRLEDSVKYPFTGDLDVKAS